MRSVIDTAALLDLSPSRAAVVAAEAAPTVDPAREAEEYDTPDPDRGFACGRGLGRRKEN